MEEKNVDDLMPPHYKKMADGFPPDEKNSLQVAPLGDECVLLNRAASNKFEDSQEDLPGCPDEHQGMSPFSDDGPQVGLARPPKPRRGWR